LNDPAQLTDSNIKLDIKHSSTQPTHQTNFNAMVNTFVLSASALTEWIFINLACFCQYLRESVTSPRCS